MAAKYPLKKGQKVSEPQFAQWQIEVLTNMAAIKITFKKKFWQETAILIGQIEPSAQSLKFFGAKNLAADLPTEFWRENYHRRVKLLR